MKLGSIETYKGILKSRHFRHGLVFLFSWLAVIGVIDQVVMPMYINKGDIVEVPDVGEMPFEDARKVLMERGFPIVVEAEKHDSEFPPGHVISQNPLAYSMVKEGRRIYVVLSKGERNVQVPTLVGTSEKNALFRVESAGLQRGRILYEHSNEPEGVVCYQSIAEGTEVSWGTAIDITISLGGFPTRFVVPSVIGKSLDDAEKLIKRAGLRLGRVEYMESDDYLPETVLGQSLKAGQEVANAETLSVLVSKLPKSASTPDEESPQ